MSDDDNLNYRFQNLHEFVKAARTNLNRNHWDYLIGASETESTLARNRMALDQIGFRPRVLRDVSKVDCSREVFGRKLRLPVLCAPVGALQVFEPGGGGTVAAATARFGNGMILSSVSEPGMEATAKAAGDGFPAATRWRSPTASRRSRHPSARPCRPASGSSPCTIRRRWCATR